ncbi:MAG: LysM peptidoglycan-binding domain-containing protein, partial [Thermoanaerobaculia bacterium]
MALDPQLQALYTSLTNSVIGGQLTLNEQTMNGASSLPVVALFQEAFGLDAITLGGPPTVIADDTNNLVLVTGSGVTTLFNLAGTSVALAFGSATPSTLSLTGTIVPPNPAAWKFSLSYPPLAETYFDSLQFTSPAFTISTYAATDSTLGVTLVEGAGIYIKPTALVGPLAPLLELKPTLASPLPPFYGPVTQDSLSFDISMAMPFSNVTVNIIGFPSLLFPNPNAMLRAQERTLDDGSEELNSTITVEANVDFGGVVTLPMTIGVPWQDQWRLGVLPGTSKEIPSLTGFLALFTSVDLIAELPVTFAMLDGYFLTTFWAPFDLRSGITVSWGFSIATDPAGPVWSIIPGVIELRALNATIVVNSVQPGGSGPYQTLTTGSMGGAFHVGGAVGLLVTIPIPATAVWTIASQNDIPLPSLADLGSLVGGVDLATILPAGVANIGAFSIQSVMLIVDPIALSIATFDLRLGSTNPWTIIPGQLSLTNLVLEFNIEDPFGTRAVTGIVYGTFRIGTFDVHAIVARQPYQGGWSMQIWSPLIPLPSIADLDELIGTSIAPYLPSSLATLSFSIYDFLIDVNLIPAVLRQMAFDLASDQEWTIIVGVLVVKQVGLRMNLSWSSGSLLTDFGVWGNLEVVGTLIDVSAMRESDGRWTFTGQLAEGEVISLGGLVTQFLHIDPAYLPALNIEGLAVTFTTNDNTFSIAGRTAGFWTYQVSSALTLQMRAAAFFQRDAAGKYSGALEGELHINNLQVFVSYVFDSTSNTLIFRILYGRFSLSAALTSGTDRKGKEYSLLKFSFGDLSLGEILEWLVNLASPGTTFKLPAPWDELNQINFKNLSVVVDLKTYDVTINYAVGVNLVFMKLTSIGFTYSDAGGEGSVKLALSGSFLGQDYSIEDGTALEWDVLHEPAPEVPATGPKLVDIKYAGLGQRVAFSDTSKLDTVGDVITALRAEMQPVKNADRNPLAVGNGSLMRFDRASHLLAGADFEVLETVSVAFIFNDPYLYGMRIALAGERAGSLAGLQFELLYKKVTNDIGVFKVELRVPDAFRQWEFGEVSITLPIIKVDVYTNGNFKVDLGFPRGTDFSDSFCLQIFPFIGFGGFYFAYLTGATSQRVPVITNGAFNPVLEFGIGLQVGLGKEIRKGPLSGGLYVTVIGILEGVVAWYSPDDKAARDGTYYWIEGIVGIVGKVYGSVDFAVIKVSVSLTARLTVRVVMESYKATIVQVRVEVEASATVTIFFIDIDFSFSVTLDEEFTIGSSSPTPWLVAPKSTTAGAPQLHMQRSGYLPRSTARELRKRLWSDSRIAARALGQPCDPLTWNPVLVFDAKQSLSMSLLPAITVATTAGSSTPALQLDFVLFVENSIAPGSSTRKELRTPSAAHSSRTGDPMTISFNLLVQSMLLWSINSVIGRMTGNVTAADLDVIYDALLDPATFETGFDYQNLVDFLAANFKGTITGVPADVINAGTTSATILAMLPQLSYSFGGTTIDFGVHNPVSPTYEEEIRTYYDQLVVDYEWGRATTSGIGASPAPQAWKEAVPDTDESMAKFIFREYFMILARTAVQAARDLLAKYSYSPASTDSLNTICGHFPPVATTYSVREGDTVASIAEMFGMTVAALEALNNDSLHDPLTPGTVVNVQIAVTPPEAAFANREAALTQAKVIPLASIIDQVKPGDSLTSIGSTFGSLAASSLIGVAVNAANRQLLVGGASMIIAQPASPSYNWFNYTSVAGDGLQSTAVWAFVRAVGDPLSNEAWYGQTIVNFNTNPQSPYAGPDLTGVIATGTPLKIPLALNDSDPTHAISYVTRVGDTLALVAGSYDVAQNQPSLLATIESGLLSLNSGVDWNNLPAGTTIHVPAQTYNVAAGDSFDSIARRFLIAATDLAAGANAGSTALLLPLSVLAIPSFSYSIGANDTLASIAERFSITIAELATDVAPVQGLFATPADPPLTIPGVPSYAISGLPALLINSGAANEAAMAVSRFLASGLRLPVEGDPSTLQSLYVLTGQQMTCPTPPATITFNKTGSWFTFSDSFVSDGTPLNKTMQKKLHTRNLALDLAAPSAGRIVFGADLDSLPIEITQALLDAYAPSTTFDPQILTGPVVLDIKQSTDVTYRLYQTVHWQTSSTIAYGGNPAAPQAGEPSIWLFSEALLSQAKILVYGTTPFALKTSAGDPDISPTTNPVLRFDWGAMINLYVRQVSAPNVSVPLPNTYAFAGSDDAGKALLLALVQHLTQNGNTDTAQIYLLYTLNADSNNSKGLASGVVDPARTFIVKTNLSTLTSSGPTATAAPKTDLYEATIAQATDFLQLLWEGSVTASGGYTLGYADSSGNGLPNEVFAASALGSLQLVVILATQSAAVNPDRKLYGYNNCAVAGDNIDISRQTVFVAVADPAKVEHRQSAALPPGNFGFTLTRKNPGTEIDSQTPEEKRTRQLYSLLAYGIVPAGGFSAGNEGLPVGPMNPDDGNTLIWSYKQVLSLTKLATSALPDAAFLPSAKADPYSGISATAQLAMELDFHDLYGNETISTTPISNLIAPVGYYDDLVGLANWPGITTSFTVSGTPAAPTLGIGAALQISNYVPGSGTTYDQAKKNASAHVTRYEAIYYQVWQSGVHLTMTTSLVEPPGAPKQSFTLALTPFAKFASASYI